MIANLGYVYQDQGRYEHALRCFEQALRIALEIGDRRLTGIVGSIANVYASQGRYDSEVERLYRQSVAIQSALNTRFYLAPTLHTLATFYFRQQRYEEARTLNDEALDMAIQIGRKDTELAAQLLEIQLDVATGDLDKKAAIRKVEALAQQWPDEQYQASVQYHLWLLDKGMESARRAADLYRKLYDKSPKVEYRKRYEELTGKRLPGPPPPPELPELITRNPVDLKALLAHVDRIAAGLQKPEGSKQ
jgi:tetratricopeptide (TPR) repeat protein